MPEEITGFLIPLATVVFRVGGVLGVDGEQAVHHRRAIHHQPDEAQGIRAFPRTRDVGDARRMLRRQLGEDQRNLRVLGVVPVIRGMTLFRRQRDLLINEIVVESDRGGIGARIGVVELGDSRPIPSAS